MLQATDQQDLETNNFQYSAENENVALCIWGNLSHNPRLVEFSSHHSSLSDRFRIQKFQFDKYSFGFDLPKPLSLANIAIVGFFLKYDYFSDRSPLSKCRARVQEYSFGKFSSLISTETFHDRS